MELDQYVPLHNHTYFSALDGYSSPEEYLERCKELGIKSFAVTEHGNEYSWVYFDKLKSKFPDIKIIFGVEMYECFDMKVKDPNNKYFHLIALARNENGRKALNRIVTKSNFEGFYFKGRIDINSIVPYANDLIICSACLGSKLAKEGDYNKCVEYVNEYKRLFPYFFLEMQSHKHIQQENYNKKILRLSRDTNTPFIITTDSHCATKEELFYQGYHVKIAHDNETASEIYEGCYLQSVEEIHEIMDNQIGYKNVCKGLKNTFIIDNLTEEVHMPFQEPQLPSYPLPKDYKTNFDYLKELVKDGWFKRKINNLDVDLAVYKKRVEYELKVIDEMKFPGYFLIVWDFINWARNNNVRIGAGRGSAAGSLVCYLLGISELDPIKHGLIFERFLNPERLTYPDVDVDLSNRDKVIQYLMDKYGDNRVCQIINYSYITPVVAIRDVGKVLGFPYTEREKLSSKFTYKTFDECVENNRKYLDDNPKYSELIDIASHLSGRLKTVSCHAGGVGIVDTDINDYMAMKLGKKGEHVIQVDKRIVEQIGIIKFDLLGVQTLNLVKEIEDDLNLSPEELDINNPNFINDKSPYTVLNTARTNGVFQVESAGMKDLLLRLQAKNLNDISVVLALYRPDTMSALNDYIDAKNGIKVIHNIHPDLDKILKDTYNCLLYQEQLMNVVRVFGGRSYGGADAFRKGIGKKDIELVKAESKKLYQEIIDNGYSKEVAEVISNDMSNKGGYCFNQSHSQSYAVLTLQTAYLKAKYPVHFFKALLNLNKDKAGMLNKYILDAKDFNVKILAPNINKSEINFSVYNDSILFGLSAISNIGESVALEIINERNKNGKFKNFDNLLERVNLGKAQVISLIKSGAIPCKNKMNMIIKYLKSCYTPNKFTYSQKLPSYKDLLLKWGIEYEDYRISSKKYDFDKEKLYEIYKKKAYDMYLEKEENKYRAYIDKHQKYLDDQEFWEFQSLQVFLTSNPFEEVYKYLNVTFQETKIGNECVIPGVLAKVQKKKDRNNKTYAFVNIYSAFGLVEAMVWHSQYKQYEELLKKGSKIAMLCKKDNEDKVMCKDIKVYDDWLLYITNKRKE